jgi:uncharacterized phage protein gp47/JayE
MADAPSQQELIDTALYYFEQAMLGVVDYTDPEEISALDARLARENNQVLAFVTGTGVHGNYRYLDGYLAKQCNPLTATDEFFVWWLDTYGITMKPANPAEGNVVFTGTPGAVVDVDVDLEIDGISYVTTEAVTIDSNGQAIVPVVALTGGVETNQDAGVELTLVNPISGVDGTATVGDDGLLRGTDAETEDEARSRLEQRIQNPPLGGAPADYERWAMEVPGITRAWGLRTPYGPGTAGVIIMADGNDNDGIPTAADQQAVFDYISDPNRGPADELFVIIPTPLYIDVELKLDPDTTDTREAVDAELRDLFFREAEPGSFIPHTHLSEAVSIAAGEFTHEFISPVITPSGQLTSGQYEILILRDVEFVA